MNIYIYVYTHYIYKNTKYFTVATDMSLPARMALRRASTSAAAATAAAKRVVVRKNVVREGDMARRPLSAVRYYRYTCMCIYICIYIYTHKIHNDT